MSSKSVAAFQEHRSDTVSFHCQICFLNLKLLKRNRYDILELFNSNGLTLYTTA